MRRGQWTATVEREQKDDVHLAEGPTAQEATRRNDEEEQFATEASTGDAASQKPALQAFLVNVTFEVERWPFYSSGR